MSPLGYSTKSVGRHLLGFLILVLQMLGFSDNLESRMGMVKDQIEIRGVKDPKVLKVMREVPRHIFVPKQYQDQAYNDHPLSIGFGQTISQPYIVAYMTEQLGLKGGEKVLEIGTGSGYQAAVLARIADSVFSIEIVCELEEMAARTLKKAGYTNVYTKCADGYKGWPEHAPFDAVILTAAPAKIPEPLIEQLKVGGRLIAPIGEYIQDLILVTKTPEGVKEEKLIGVRFVPMTGKAQKE
jgi:protein-L-isoaspartate(D-aspartate) O-methyltransferase